MTKLIIFDLDGVLVEAKDIHYKTLNNAIEQVAGQDYVITEAEHLSTYDGLKTSQKLQLLTKGCRLNHTIQYGKRNRALQLTLSRN
jgi:beta-phosphoglucomutase